MITIEDVNGAIFRDGVNSYLHEIDTSFISDSMDFDDVIYDFVKVSRSTSGSNITYTFEVKNNAWTGECWFTETDGTYINKTINYNNSTHKITFTTTHTSVVLHLYCSHLTSSFLFKKIYVEPVCLCETTNPVQCIDSSALKLNEFSTIHWIVFKSLLNNSQVQDTLSVSGPGVIEAAYSNDTKFYYLSRLIKTDLDFTCNQSLVCGKVNNVVLGVDNKYKPGGALIRNYAPNITVEYGDVVVPVSFDEDLNDYTFELDLTNVNTPGKVRFSVIVGDNKVINGKVTDVDLMSSYESVSSCSDLLVQCGDGGSDIIQLTGDIILTSSIPVNHSIIIKGEGHTIDLNRHNFILSEGVTFNVEKLTFDNGDTTIMQQKNTKVELTKCTFHNCTSSDYNNLGSCIFCHIDLESLDIPNDFITILDNCTFTNNHNAILHGGELTVKDCKLRNTDLDYIDSNNSAFLYQTDGEAIIKNSVFDLDYGTDYSLCNNEETIGFAQCLIIMGENAIINETTSEQIKNNKTLTFIEDYGNRSHAFMKYYYPTLETCVYTSPIPGYEDKSFCYAVSGINWVYKENIQVTRASWNSENTTRKIVWED